MGISIKICLPGYSSDWPFGFGVIDGPSKFPDNSPGSTLVGKRVGKDYTRQC